MLRDALLDPVEYWMSLGKADERKGLRRSDVILGIQAHESRYDELLTHGRPPPLIPSQDGRSNGPLRCPGIKTWIPVRRNHGPLSVACVSQFRQSHQLLRLPVRAVGGRPMAMDFGDSLTTPRVYRQGLSQGKGLD